MFKNIKIGLYGFSAYSPTKFALNGLAQVLRMEVFKLKSI